MDKLQKLELKQQIERQEEQMELWGNRIIEHVNAIDEMTEELSETSDEELASLAEEDVTALECLVARYMENRDIQNATLAAIEGINKNSRYCSETLETIIEAKVATLDNDNMLLFLAMQEQGMYHKYYKYLSDLGEDKLEEVNTQVFNNALYGAMLEGYAQVNKGAAITLTVERATKSVPVKNPEKTYVISLSYDNNFSLFGIYFYFDHSKKGNEEASIKAIAKLLDSATENIITSFNPSDLRYDILGKETIKIASATGKSKQAFYEATGNIKTENINVKLEKTAGGALDLLMCKQCGRSINNNGTCDYCGASNEQTKRNTACIDRNGNFVLNVTEIENSELLLLSCSQCASPIETNAADGNNVVCSACGASFVLNKQAITLTHGGILRKQMEQDKPKNEDFPIATFAVRPLYNGRLGITMPEQFTVMGTEMKAFKYPRGNPPELVLTDERGAINYTFSPMHNAKAKESEIGAVSASVLGSLKKMIPTATVGEKGIIQSQNHNISFFELITPANEDIYNLMLHFNLSGTLMTASFNCLAKERWFWSPVFLLAAKSIKFDD